MFLQHQDINVGPGSYRDLIDDELLVTKIFFTIQGEGPYAGVPSIFVRMAGCNRGEKIGMGCTFCDTKFHFKDGKPMTMAAIISDMKACSTKLQEQLLKPLVVITGGEPMLQPHLVDFIAMLQTEDYRDIQIESNGDRLAKGWMRNQVTGKVTLVVSPKAEAEYKPLSEVVYNAASALKFVISGDPASPYYNVPSYARGFALNSIRPRPVYLSPLTAYKKAALDTPTLWNVDLIDVEETRDNYNRAVDLCMTHGFRMSTQQHLLYGVE